MGFSPPPFQYADRTRRMRAGVEGLRWMCAAALAASLGCVPAGAGPEGESVVAGAVQVSRPDALTTQVNQLTDRAIINWKGFSLDVNELVRFVQPGAGSIALNRVTGGDPSVILGQLLANGRVFLLNRNGILFGASAKVDVGGLLATTMDIRDADFLRGHHDFAQSPGGKPAFVVNRGQIRIAEDGFAFLVAPAVRNEGLIIASLGKVVLGSGTQLTVDLGGDRLVSFAVSGRVAEAIRGPDGAPSDAAVSNAGVIESPGGQVVLTADAAREVVSAAVNQEGTVRTLSTAAAQGEVLLEARSEGLAQNTGIVDASGSQLDVSGRGTGSGGNVTVLSDGQANLSAGAAVLARGGGAGGLSR